MSLASNPSTGLTAWGVGNALFLAQGSEAPKQVTHEKLAAAKLVHRVCISADGKYVVALADKSIVLVDPATGSVLSTAETARRGTGVAIGVAGTEHVVVTIDASAEMRAWRMPALDKQVFLAGHAMSVLSAVAVGPGDDVVASGDREGRIRVSSFPVAPLIRGVCFLHDRYVTALQWLPAATALPDAKAVDSAGIPPTVLLSAAADGRVGLWHATAEPPQLLGSTDVAPFLTPGGEVPAVAVATTGASAASAEDDQIAAVAEASGAKLRSFRAFDYVSHAVAATAVVGNTLGVVVYGVPQILFFALTPNATGRGVSEPSATADADAVTFAFLGRAMLGGQVATMTAVEGHFLVAHADGTFVAFAPVAGGTPAPVVHALATALTAAGTAAGVDFAAAAKASETVLPSPLDLAFAMGGTKSMKDARSAVSATAASAAAAAEAEGGAAVGGV